MLFHGHMAWGGVNPKLGLWTMNGICMEYVWNNVESLGITWNHLWNNEEYAWNVHVQFDKTRIHKWDRYGLRRTSPAAPFIWFCPVFETIPELFHNRVFENEASKKA